jgi:hypothetical protein
MLLTTGTRLVQLIRQALLPSLFPGPLRYLSRLALMAGFLPLLCLSQLINWLGLALDEMLFRGYRRVAIERPVFVLGVPRSGTTFMHRLLAASPECTTFATWECLLAPSVSQRYVWHGLAACDRLIGRPVGRLLRRLEGRLLRRLEGRLLERTGGVHPTGLFEPEEDYYCFMPVLCCFILILPFPEADWLWRMARFDRDLSPAERSACLDWYHRCLQRHLYFHGTDKRLLSKNASFAGMALSLAERYPDCGIVVCERDIESVIESQFRSLASGMRFFGIRRDDPEFREKLLDCIVFYYGNLERAICSIGRERHVRVPLLALSTDTRRIVSTICRRFTLRQTGPIDNAISDYEGARGAAAA